MVISCCALNCSERFVKGGKVSFHMFPENSELRARWICAVRRVSWLPNNYSRICSLHFNPACFKIFNGKKYLSQNAVPTLFDYRESIKKFNAPPKKRMLSSKTMDFSKLMGSFTRPVEGSRKLVHGPRKQVVDNSNRPFDSFSRQVGCSSTPTDGSSKPASGFSWPVDSLWGNIIGSDSKLEGIASDRSRPADSTTSMVLEQDSMYVEREIVILSESAEMKSDCIQEDSLEDNRLGASRKAEATPIVESEADDEEEEGRLLENHTVAENGCQLLDAVAGRVAGPTPSRQRAADLAEDATGRPTSRLHDLRMNEVDALYEWQSRAAQTKQDVAEALLAEGKGLSLVAAGSSGADSPGKEHPEVMVTEQDIAAFLAESPRQVPGAKEGPDSCMLCGRAAGHGVSVLQLTGATGVPLRRRLKVLAVGEGLQPPRGSLVCLRCCHVLNYADRIELEMALLKRTIAECVCSTHHLRLPLPGGELRYG